MSRLRRYRLFYVLLDAATLMTLVSLARLALDPGHVFADRPDAILFRIVGVLALLLPAILIFVRPIRDEFAERLWQAAAGATLRGLIWIPFALLFAIGVRDGFLGSAPANPAASIDGADMLALMIMLQLTLFVLALQWHRWRASR